MEKTPVTVFFAVFPARNSRYGSLPRDYRTAAIQLPTIASGATKLNETKLTPWDIDDTSRWFHTRAIGVEFTSALILINPSNFA